MGSAVGAGYTPTLFPPSPVTILNFPGLLCAILSRHKGDNDKDSTTAAPKFPSLFYLPQLTELGPRVPVARFPWPNLFWDIKEVRRDQQ